MTRRLAQSALFLFLFAGSLHAQTTRAALLKVAGETFPASAAPSEYNESSVDKLDPAIAEALKLYGLRGVSVQHSTGPRITLFEMVDSAAAYGFFTFQRSTSAGEPTPTLIGADSFRRDGQLYFWQANYAVRIDGPVEAQDKLAKALSQSILGRSRKPTVSEYLPPANAVAGTERYLIRPEDVPTAVGIDPNQLGFDSSAEAAAATYRGNGGQANLLLVLYPTHHIAKKYTEALQEGSSAFRKRAGPLFAVVYGTKDEASAAAILDGVSHEFKVTWDDGEPDLAIGTLIITIFVGIAILLAITLFAGVGFGGLRIFVKSRFPNTAFATGQNTEVIQLKLVQRVTDNQIGDEKGIS